jgi:site-specific DNA-methyltransferase (adenine-specific)
VVREFPQTAKGAVPSHRNISHFGHQAEGYIGERIEYEGGSAARFFYCAKASKSERNHGCGGMEEKETMRYGDFNGTPEHAPKKNIKNTNNHPTVKPIALMRYLCRMVTPKGGIVLDPFMGSGTTGIAAKVEGYSFIGIEREEEYCKIAEARIAAWEEEKPDAQQKLF